MAGTLIVGMPRCGKGLYCKKVLIPSLRRAGRPVAVLDPLTADVSRDQAKRIWGADHVFKEAAPCIASAKASTGATYIVDEMGVWRKDYAATAAVEWLAVAGGNYGILGVFIAQRVVMIPPNIRDLAESAIVFGQAEVELKDLAILFRQPAILEAGRFKPGQAIVVEPFKDPVYIDLFIDYPDAFPTRSGEKRGKTRR